MKNTIKLFFVLVLFCSTVFADGSMGAGGFTGDGSMGAGGKTCQTNCLADNQPTVDPNSTEKNSTDSAIEFIKEYLSVIFG